MRAEGPLACPIVDGRVALSIVAPAGMVVDGGERPKTVPADGKLDVEVPVVDWLGAIAVDAVAARYEDGERVRVKVPWAIAPHAAALGARLGAASRSSVVRIGGGYEREPESSVDPTKNLRELEDRRRVLVGLAKSYMHAARRGHVSLARHPVKAGSALVEEPAVRGDAPAAPADSPSLYVFGDAVTLADVERFAVAERATTGKTLDRCGPYEKDNGEPGSWTVPRMRVDVRLTGWKRSGDALPAGIVRGGERGCPKLLVGLPTSYEDAPTVVQLGAWLTDS